MWLLAPRVTATNLTPDRSPDDLLLLASKREVAKLLSHLVAGLYLRLRQLSRLFWKVQDQSLKFGYCFLRSIRLFFEEAF
jgi:hypothetical protein